MSDSMNLLQKRILICLGSSPSERLIRTAFEAASDKNAKLFAVHITVGRSLLRPEEDRERSVENLMAAERAGAQTITLKSSNIADEVLEVALQKNITDIFIGRPKQSSFAGHILRSPVHKLLQAIQGIDVHVIDEEAADSAGLRSPVPLADYGSAIMFWILATVLCFAMFPLFDLSNLIMVYLLAVLITAIGCGRGPAMMNSFLCVLSFDFCFVPPRWSFTVYDAQYIVTFVVMFVIAIAISNLTARLRREATTARLQERQTNAMHGLSRQLANVRGTEEILNIAERYIAEIFNSRVAAMVPGEKGKLSIVSGSAAAVIEKDMIKELELAQSVYASGRMEGWGTPYSPNIEILCVPLKTSQIALGVLALKPSNVHKVFTRQQMDLLGSLVNQIALALEVEHVYKSSSTCANVQH